MFGAKVNIEISLMKFTILSSSVQWLAVSDKNVVVSVAVTVAVAVAVIVL